MNTSDLKSQLQHSTKRLIEFRMLLFIGILVLLYGFIVLRIQTLSSAKPDQNAVASQVSTSRPHIDQPTINKIKQLQDNSVSVQALFNQSRQNPFHE
ncbi:MAG TPA: hypothetical protein VLH84_02375 [Patescibacteria group bacterium]|nr:hypothetical protein [Patescibacteria group bacterium]